MEIETNPNIALKPPPLNSDQLNYLIWRYLQEAGYGEAAVKLQRDWKVEPETLPFAKHIKGQALVSLVQKGLRYHHLSLTIDENGQPLKQISPSTFFFGAESGRPTTPSSAKEPLYRAAEARRASSPPSSTTKKREIDSNGPFDPTTAPAKRSRKTTQASANDRNGNGPRKTSASTADAMSAMDLDHINGHVGSLSNMRSPSIGDNLHDDNIVNGATVDARMDVDMEDTALGASGMDGVPNEMNDFPPPLIYTLTNGESIGIQVDPAKVENLGPSTTILSSPENSSITKIVWRPTDVPLLTVTGDHFCGAWRSVNANISDEGSKMAYQDLLGINDPSLITAVAWDSTGGLLAIATYAEQTGQLHLFDGNELMLIENMPASQRAITSLKWLPSAFRLVGIAPYEDQALGHETSSTIMLWDFSEKQFSAAPLTLAVPELLLDVDSARHGNQGVICAAGGNAVYHCRANKELLVEEKWSSASPEGTNWAFVKCHWQNDHKHVIVVASSENSRIWLPIQDITRVNAHEAPITGLELRPRAIQNNPFSLVPDFATSSMDGTIKVWRYEHQSKSIEVIYRLTIGHGLPIMSILFSPDGFCLAGASFGDARIWNAEHGYNLMAAWEGKSEDWRGTSLRDEDAMSAGGLSSINSDGGTINTDHSLAWDMDSKKLAFGLASQIAIINFQR